ncbi:MAG TPA: lipopolysaccharide biosynthesis protein [Promineifilum sp.]|nr:lipopolysaccharide biosynthesis protein [Promineifilum sp.]
MSNLKIRAARGSMYMTAISFGLRPISMLLSILVARLLTPEDFGLVALAMILLNAANLITDLGMRPGIVQTKEDIEKVAYYAFVMVMAASMALSALIWLFAPPLANVLGGGAELVPILRAMAILVTFDGLWIVPEALLRRDLRFKQRGFSQIPAELASTIIAIVMALMGFGVWSLVVGQLASELLRAILLWSYYRPWIWIKPKKWDKEIVHGMLSFGLPSMGSGVLKIFSNQVDTWIVGRRLGPSSVGLYNKAFNLTTRLSDMLTASVFGNVLFPSYAKMQDDKARLGRAYLKSTKMVFLIIVPVSVGLAITAPLLVPVLLGPKWLAMIPIWQVFSLYGLTRPISTNSAPIFLATGQPKRNMTASLVLLATMLPLIFLLIGPYGTVGVAVAVSLASTIAMLFNMFQVNQILPGTAIKTFVQGLPFFVAGALMTLGVVLLQGPIVNLTGGENLSALILVIIAAALIYIAAILVLQRPLVLELYELTIMALGFDKRWPRLLPARLRTGK